MMTDIAPPRGAIGLGITLLQVAVTLTTYNAERTNPMEYSKFATIKEGKLKNPVHSKLGMFIIYAPATIAAYLYAFSNVLQNTSPAASLLFVHFLKRTLEVLCLHKYSGNMEYQSAFSIATIYVLYTMLISTFAVRFGQNDETWITVGYGLFVIGIVGNFYHHYLLASLRSSSKNNNDFKVGEKKTYHAPVGGAFALVAAPHYLFELIMWLGIACVAQQVNAFLVLAGMTSYLLARGKNTNDYYFSKFDKDEWPPTRKAVIPYLL